MIYIAAPYSHSDPNVKAERMRQFYKFDAELTNQGKFTTSPLLKVETCKHGSVPDTWEYWRDYSYALLSMCDQMIVLMFDGWNESVGVQAEIEYCLQNNIPITYTNAPID